MRNKGQFISGHTVLREVIAQKVLVKIAQKD